MQNRAAGWEVDDVMVVTPARSSLQTREHPTNRKDKGGGGEGGDGEGVVIMRYGRAGSRCDSLAPAHLTHIGARQQEAPVWSIGASLLGARAPQTQKDELLLT